jgi:hypothetical protein
LKINPQSRGLDLVKLGEIAQGALRHRLAYETKPTGEVSTLTSLILPSLMTSTSFEMICNPTRLRLSNIARLM